MRQFRCRRVHLLHAPVAAMIALVTAGACGASRAVVGTTAPTSAMDLQGVGASHAHPSAVAAEHSEAAPSNSAAASSPPAVATAPSVSLDEFGRPGASVAVGRVDPQAHWAYYCESASHVIAGPKEPFRFGSFAKQSLPYLAIGSRAPLPLSAFLSSSADGRFLVYLSDAQELVLYDTWLNTATDLTSLDWDLRADGLPGEPRFVAFSHDSSKLVWLTKTRPVRAVVRDLLQGTQTEIHPLGESVWRIGFDAADRYIVLREVLEDTNKNGRLDWPVPERPLRDTHCRIAAGALDAWVPNGDGVVTTLAPVGGGDATRMDDFVTSLGAASVLHRPGEGLVSVSSKRTVKLNSADCEPHVMAIAPQFGQMLLSCSDKSGTVHLELASATGFQPLDYDAPLGNRDYLEPVRARYFPVYSGSRTYLIDFAERRARELQPRDQLLAQSSAGYLLRRGSAVVWLGPSEREPKTILEGVRPGAQVLTGLNFALVGTTVLGVESTTPVRAVPQLPVALADNGCVLIALGARAPGSNYPSGPLKWDCPSSDPSGGIESKP